MMPLTKTYKTGMHLFHEFDRSRELYIISSGTVKVYRKTGNREVELAVLGKGAVLGEMALIDGKPRSASAKALEECSVVLIDADTFHDKIKGVPVWFMSIVRMTSQKIRHANLRLNTISSEYQGANIILVLCYCFGRFAVEGELDLKTTKQQILQMLETTYQRVIRVFDFLQENEFCSINENRICIANPEKLAEYCSFLRRLVVKGFEKMPQLSQGAARVLSALVKQKPDILRHEDAVTEIGGEEILAILKETLLEQQCSEILVSLRDCGLCTVTRSDSGDKAAHPLANGVVRFINSLCIRQYLYATYDGVVPNV